MSVFGRLIDWIWNYTPHPVEKRQLNITDEDLNVSKKLSTILVNKTEIGTITNILEWQEQNINYWFERAESSILVHFALVAILLLLSMLAIISTTSLQVILLVVIVIYSLFFVMYPSNFTLALIFLGIVCELLYFFVTHRINLPPFYLGCGYLIGIILGIYMLLGLKYNHMAKKIGFKYDIKVIVKMLILTFDIKLPIKSLLEYKSAICRDYAILSSAILMNLKMEPFFIVIPLHVATAIKLNGSFYMIDQRLPIKELDKWLKHNNQKNCRIYKPSFDIVSNKTKLDFVKRYTTKNENNTTIPNFEKLEHDINIHFGLSNKCENDSTEIIIGNKAAFFYDEVTHLSIMRKAIIEIEKQFCSNLSNVSYIGIKKYDDDLVAVVYQ